MMAGWPASRFAALVLLFLAGGPAFAATIKLVDDGGRIVTLPAPARRIVSLAPHATELVFAAGAGNRLVGVTSYSDYPAAAKKIPQIGSYGKIDVERILALKPDLVIGWQSGNSAADIASLERLHIPVFLTEPLRLEDISRLIKTIGELAGTQQDAAKTADNFSEEVAALRRRYGGRRPVRVFYEIWHDPLLTVNGAHFISDIIAVCGGRNVFAGVRSLVPRISTESVLAENPEAIIGGGRRNGKRGLLDGWRHYPRLTAVSRNHLLLVNPDLIHRPTPRTLDGVRQMCEQIERVRRSDRHFPQVTGAGGD